MKKKKKTKYAAYTLHYMTFQNFYFVTRTTVILFKLYYSNKFNDALHTLYNQFVFAKHQISLSCPCKSTAKKNQQQRNFTTVFLFCVQCVKFLTRVACICFRLYIGGGKLMKLWLAIKRAAAPARARGARGNSARASRSRTHASFIRNAR